MNEEIKTNTDVKTMKQLRQVMQQEPQSLQSESFGPCRDNVKTILRQRADLLEKKVHLMKALANSLPEVFHGEAEEAMYQLINKQL